jgi:hypothetical protein
MKNNKKRMAIITLLGVAAIAAILFLSNSNEFSPPAPPALVPVPQAVSGSATPAAVANATISATTPILPKGAELAGQVMRDIFSPQVEYAALSPSPGGADPVHGNAAKTVSTAQIPVLTGLIEGDGSRVVILRQGTLSRSYRVGQAAGAYTVDAIDANSVTLTGPAGTTVLTMGQ